MLNIYTDGSCSQAGKSNGIGGWGLYVEKDGVEVKRDSGIDSNTTNNKMELLAFIKGLDFALNSNEPVVNIYTDSAYIHNCLQQKWYERWMINSWRTSNRKLVKNKELWQELFDKYFILNTKCKLNVMKVKGHADNIGNNIADKLARRWQ